MPLSNKQYRTLENNSTIIINSNNNSSNTSTSNNNNNNSFAGTVDDDDHLNSSSYRTKDEERDDDDDDVDSTPLSSSQKTKKKKKKKASPAAFLRVFSRVNSTTNKKPLSEQKYSYNDEDDLYGREQTTSSMISSTTTTTTTTTNDDNAEHDEKEELTPGRGQLWSPGTPITRKMRTTHRYLDTDIDTDGEDTTTTTNNNNSNSNNERESVITQYTGDDHHHNVYTSSTAATTTTIQNRTKTTSNLFVRIFGACFGGSTASTSSQQQQQYTNKRIQKKINNGNKNNAKNSQTIKEDAKAPLRKEEKAPIVAGCVPVPCLKPQFSNIVGEGFTLHTGAYFLPAPETYSFVPTTNNDKTPQTMRTSKPCLVLDLDETLVHSSFRPVPNPDYIIPVEIDGKITDVYVLKRPWVDLFLTEMAKRYELVVFTASLAKYANPLMDKLDIYKVVKHRLFRDACYPFQGNYVKDLTCLGRDLRKTIIIDNSPYSYMFHPQNALPVSSFIDDPRDDALFEMIPFLIDLSSCEDVTEFLRANNFYMPREKFLPVKIYERPDFDRLGNKII